MGNDRLGPNHVTITEITEEKLDDLTKHLSLGREFLTYEDVKVIHEFVRREKNAIKFHKLAIEHGLIFGDNKEK